MRSAPLGLTSPVLQSSAASAGGDTGLAMRESSVKEQFQLGTDLRGTPIASGVIMRAVQRYSGATAATGEGSGHVG
jgi:hypothetical protein